MEKLELIGFVIKFLYRYLKQTKGLRKLGLLNLTTFLSLKLMFYRKHLQRNVKSKLRFEFIFGYSIQYLFVELLLNSALIFIHTNKKTIEHILSVRWFRIMMGYKFIKVTINEATSLRYREIY